MRKAIRGSSERPRLTVNRSHRNLSCQIIDDSAGKTLVSASTNDKDLRPKMGYGGNKSAAARLLGLDRRTLLRKGF